MLERAWSEAWAEPSGAWVLRVLSTDGFVDGV